MRKTDLSTFRRYCSRPERIVWAVAEYEGERSICPLGWKMNTSGSPPMIAVSVAPSRFTHELIVKAGEFVLAWPGEELAEATLFCGTRSGRGLDKFKEAKLSAARGEYVKAPLIKECIANLECRLAGRLETGDHTIFAGEILAVWVNDKPSRLLCSVGRSEGYDFLLEGKGYRFGVIK